MCGRVLVLGGERCSQKLIVAQQFKFLVFNSPKCSLLCSQGPASGPCPEPEESSPDPVYIKSILILSSHVYLGFLSFRGPSGYPTKMLCTFLISPIFKSWLDHPNNLWKVQIMKLHFYRFFPTSYHFIPISSQYSSQHLVVKHPKSVFFSTCKRPNFNLHERKGKIMVFNMLFFMFVDVCQRDKRFWTVC